MRVIAGQFRSRLLQAPRGNSTRPTSDRLRETLFSVLAGRIEAAQFVDLYAGSGAVGIEAISRGAAGCVLVESDPPALNAMRTNLAALGIKAGVQIEARAVRPALDIMLRQAQKLGVLKAGADLIFLDPPYEAASEYASTLDFLGRNATALLREDALVIAEHSRKHSLNLRYNALERTRVLEQGDAALSFFRTAVPSTSQSPSTS